MPFFSPPPKKTTVVRLVIAVGLAALVSYQQYYQRAAAPDAGVPSAAPSAASATATMSSRARASAALLALPELQAWSRQIEHQSGGKAHGGLMQYDAAPRLVDGKRYWQFSFVNNTPEAAHRLESFLVEEDSQEILVEDDATDELWSLLRWRKEGKPMARLGGERPD